MKPAIWIDGGMHAREWISPAVATWILHSLVEGENGNGTYFNYYSTKRVEYQQHNNHRCRHRNVTNSRLVHHASSES